MVETRCQMLSSYDASQRGDALDEITLYVKNRPATVVGDEQDIAL